MSEQLYKVLRGDTTIKGKALLALGKANYGSVSWARLLLTGDVIDQEVFQLGDDVYEIHDIDTDTLSESTVAVGAGDVSITFDVAPAIALVPGAVIRMESEFMVVLEVGSTTDVQVLRGAFGSTAATHSIANSDTFQAAQAVVADALAIPFAGTLTAAVADGFITDSVDFWKAGYSKGIGRGLGTTVKAGLEVTAQLDASATAIYFLRAGAEGLAATEGFTNGTISANFEVENEIGTVEKTTVVRPIVTADEAAVTLDIALAFTPTAVDVNMYTAGVAVTNGPTVSAVDNQIVTITEGTDVFTDGDVLVVTAYK